jgi:hypothetical protein
MIASPVRRWFRFSLRTLFVVVTVFACWLGCQLNWIRQRHEHLRRFPEKQFHDVAAPLSLRPFGEAGVEWLNVDDGPGVGELRSLFPEAAFWVTTPPGER